MRSKLDKFNISGGEGLEPSTEGNQGPVQGQTRLSTLPFRNFISRTVIMINEVITFHSETEVVTLIVNYV